MEAMAASHSSMGKDVHCDCTVALGIDLYGLRWPQHDIRARKKIEPAWQNRGSNNDREGDRQTREKFKSNISRKKLRFEETHDVMFDGSGQKRHRDVNPIAQDSWGGSPPGQKRHRDVNPIAQDSWGGSPPGQKRHRDVNPSSAGQLGRKSARSKAAQGCQSTGGAQSQSWRAACAANRAQSVGFRGWELGRQS
ncbi:hypothetical protein THAOC_04306 [Thalassiosira oceanica]|uniref:Uncharacterized protein n=1 Tax=Thalassiosira oceanica TaxID=159749 RepID=K0T929_THAOC|nr:hypothetical protein THAOC_04306 [Thalassiosira oceanica]|eukprot:EJK74045.1 hypothetical protein THAOC_04306 [Thalassiosira oceanica]